jgi:phosphatidylinositol glycan class M
MGLFPNQSSITTAIQPLSTPGTPVRSVDQNKPQPKLDVRWKHAIFLSVSLLTFFMLSAATFYRYGWVGIEQSILYHLKRRDHRHNFSPYWLMFYYDSAKTPQSPTSYSSLTSILPFLPQAALTVSIAMAYGKRDFCFSLFLQTFLFVSLNKVCTSQVL